jgi:hypothetical protein
MNGGKKPMKIIPFAMQNKRALDVLSERKFIITALSSGWFDNTQSLTDAISGEWHFNNFAQIFDG